MQMLVFLLMLSEIPTMQAYTQLPFKEAILFKICVHFQQEVNHPATQMAAISIRRHIWNMVLKLSYR